MDSRVPVVLLMIMLAVFLISGPVTANDDFEPNDEIDNATSITPGEYDGLSLAGTEADYYEISVSRGETLNVTARFSTAGAAEVDPELTLLDGDGNVLEFSGSRVDGGDTVNYRLTWEATEDRTVYLDVESNRSGSTGGSSASYDLSLQRGENDKFEPNGARSQAPETPPGVYDGLTLLAGEEDYYRISVSGGETLNVTATFSTAGDETVNPELTLIDGDGELLEFSGSRVTSGSDTVEHRLTWEATGDRTVYLRVGSTLSVIENDFSASYDLSIGRGENDRFEPNGARSQAPPIGPGTYEGLTLLGGESDYHAISIKAGETLEATATFQEEGGAAVAPTLTLLDTDGNVLEFSETGLTTSGSDTVTYRLTWEATDDRTVYLRVDSVPSVPENDLSASYNLSIERGENDRFEPNGVPDRTSTIAPGTYEDLTLLGGESDYYAVTVAAGETLEATATFTEEGEGAVVPELTLIDGDDNVLEFSVIQLATNGSDTVEYRLTWEATSRQTVFLNVESTRSAPADDLSTSYDLLVNRGENDKLEPNGVRDKAPETPPEAYDGLTLLPGENDYYKIQVSTGETVNVTATFEEDGAAAVTPELTLFDNNGEVLEFSGSRLPGGGDTVQYRLTWEATADRTVYLNVRSVLFASANNFSASYDLSIERGENDQLEPNGARSQAPETPPGTYNGLTLLAEEDDYYAIPVSAGETVNVTATFSSAGDETVAPELALIDGDGELFEFSDSRLQRGGETVEYRLTWEATADRTVYLRVASVLSVSADDFSASYDLTIRRGENDRFEPSGVPDQTPPIGPGTYDRLALLGGEHDYYTVSVTAGERLEATATFREDDEAAVAPGLTLLDGDGNVLDFSVSRLERGGDVVEYRLTWEATADRTVYLAVESDPSASTGGLRGSYNLTLSDTVAPVADAGQALTVGVNESIRFDGSNSTDNGAIAGYEWAFGNGDNATGERVTAVYDEPGTHEVRLTVIDEAGNAGTDTVTVNVTGSDTSQTAVPPQTTSTPTPTPIPDTTDTTGTTATANGDGGGVVSLPGFGVGPAVAALIGVAYMLRRRLD